ncbi:hypothetical protein ABBQ38_001514 [Trebouxia sp. C0009 RCD-2024]
MIIGMQVKPQWAVRGLLSTRKSTGFTAILLQFSFAIWIINYPIVSPFAVKWHIGEIGGGGAGGVGWGCREGSDEEADAKMWQDLPADVNQLADADELGNMLEAFYKADLSDEFAPDAADHMVSSDWVQASGVFDLHDPFFDVSKESIAVPEEIDLSLQPTGRSGPAYDAAAMVDKLMS